MRRRRVSTTLVLAGLLASLTTFASSGTASAAEYIPELQWPAVQVGNYSQSESSPQGETTLGCDRYNGASDLVTYDSAGNEVRRLSSTQQIDGVANCIYNIAVDKNGDLYGSPYQAPNLLAYDGNALKWKYPLGCTYYMANPVVGADRNIYAINNSGRLLGLTPEVEPGTTQPKKILDVPVSNARCDTQLLALKDGLVALQNLKATFYSYNGVNLGTTPSDAIVRQENDPISATGRVFYDRYIQSGGLRSATISAYDYGRKQTTWTSTVSANGAYVYSAAPRATPDGGTVVYLQEKEQDQFGTFTGYMAYNVVKVNAFGIVQWRKNLPRIDASQNEFTGAEVKVDVNGNVVVARNGQLKTNDPYNGYVEGISIAVFNSSGTVIYDKFMRGNLDKNTGAVTGYFLKYSTLQPAPGVLYFAAQPCTNSCASTTKLYPIKVTGLGLDYPRGAVLAIPLPLKPYVPLGDSISSGQGAGVYDTDTVTDTNRCYKSYNGFGRILGRDTSSPLTLTNFAACGGSVTDNIDTNTTYPGVTQKQNQTLSSDTKVVSLTIGGNDIGFADVVTECIKASVGLGDCNAAIASARGKLQGLPVKLTRIYTDILSKTSSQNGGADAQIYVLGYAPLLSANAPDCTVNDYPFGGDDKAAAIQLLNDLNKTISNTVEAVNNSRIQYVNPMGVNSPFMGHSLCTSEPYFHGFTGPDTSESFHPNPKGQKAYADLLAEYVLVS
jgi:lysophospholipase L1-like esterase